MNFEFTEGHLVGFHAGQTRGEIENLFGEKPKQFLKSPFCDIPTDEYRDRSVHVYFNRDDVIESIEIMRPNVFLCFGRNVLGEKAREVVDWLQLEDPSFTEFDLGYSLSNGRLKLYVPDKGDHPDVLIKAVYVDFES
jgi:hypothetical protein